MSVRQLRVEFALVFSLTVLAFIATIMMTGCKVDPTAPTVVQTSPSGASATLGGDIGQSPTSIPGMKPEWTAEIIKTVQGGLLAKLNAADNDMARFCPKYKTLSSEKQAAVWAYLSGAIMKFESNYDTQCKYTESNGAISQGLFQLTYGDAHCPKSKAEGDLSNPLVNIRCALQLMADYTARDGVVAAGGYVSYGAPSPKGLARYWSVMRVPDSHSKHSLDSIIAMVKAAPGC